MSKKLSLRLGWKRNAGLVCVAYKAYTVHLGVQPRDWLWGPAYSWYDGSLLEFGLGPWMHANWCECASEPGDVEPPGWLQDWVEKHGCR